MIIIIKKNLEKKNLIFIFFENDFHYYKSGIYFFLFEIPNFSLCLSLNTTIAAAINKIAPASYNNAEGSISFPCRIINLLNAVIAIKRGKEIEIDCCSQNTLTIAITSRYKNIKSKSARLTL